MFNEFRKSLAGFVTSRFNVLTMLFFLCAGILLYRLFDLQILHGQEYMDSFQLIIRKEKEIPGTRGNIYDRKGNLLAYNELASSVTIEDVYDTGKGRNASINQTINTLIELIEKNDDELVGNFYIQLDENGNYAFRVEGTGLLRFLADVYGRTTIDELEAEERTKTAADVVYDLAARFEIGSYADPDDADSFRPGEGYTRERLLKVLGIRYDMWLNNFAKYINTVVATNVGEKTVADVMENSAALPGVSIAESTARRYVDAEYFSQILGHTGKISSQEELSALREENPNYGMNDIVGKSGIEQAYETTLQGRKGSETVFVDKLGKVIETSDYIEAMAGNDVYLTIDKELQEAAYDILENRLAGILISKIENVRADGTTESGGLSIPITDVYYALLNNSVIDIRHFSAPDAGETERAVQARFEGKKEAVLERLFLELTEERTAYKDLPQEYQSYESYVASLLYEDGILMPDAVDREDETYIAWTTNEVISLNEYLHYAIAQNWVDIAKLELKDRYSDAGEVYGRIVDYIRAQLSPDVDFDKRIYRYMVDAGEISGADICNMLLEQEVVSLDEETLGIWERGGVNAYTFLINRIRSLDITPAQLALDPCTGSMVITDVNNGDILALVSYPSYDNNKMSNGVDADYFAKLQKDLSRPQINYATQQRTAPGSTYKMVTATAALMEDVVSLYDTFTCTGVFDLIGDAPHCWIYPGGHGAMNLTSAIRNSCNNYFYEIGYLLGQSNGVYSSDAGVARLARYADLYGLSETTGIEISESEPIVSDFDAVRSAIGQGTNSYTTVGLARYVTAVANSGVCYELTLVDRVTDPSGNLLRDNSAAVRNRIDMPAAWWNAIHTGMRQVVTDKAYFDDLKVAVAGKTGTAQESRTRANHALFVSYAPYDNPEIAIATRVANGYSSSYAAQITRDVYQYYYDESARDELLEHTAHQLEGGADNAD